MNGFPKNGTKINVNDTLEGKVRLVKDIDINITDGSSPVTPDAVNLVGNVMTIEVPAAGGGGSVGATLMKTGQTTSYRTGDDGDLESGRLTSFSVLPSNNPFGNTNRFTDELGGSTYTNNIVIDWSTYDGSTVLGYKRTSSATTVTWNNAIDGALAVSIGTFTTGWRLPNVTEYINIQNRSIAFTSGAFNYSPFNNADGTFWTGNTLGGSSANKFYIFNFGFGVNFQGEANLLKYLAVRTFTVTGTTLS